MKLKFRKMTGMLASGYEVLLDGKVLGTVRKDSWSGGWNAYTGRRWRDEKKAGYGSTRIGAAEHLKAEKCPICETDLSLCGCEELSREKQVRNT